MKGLRNYFNNIKPNFINDGKYNKWFPLFDAIEKKKAEKNIAPTDEFNKKTDKAVFDPKNHFEEFNKIRQKIIKTINSPRKKKPGWML